MAEIEELDQPTKMDLVYVESISIHFGMKRMACR